MKWCAITALAAAIVIKFAWHSSIELGIPVSPNGDRGYPISTCVFWVLLFIALVSGLLALVRKRAR